MQIPLESATFFHTAQGSEDTGKPAWNPDLRYLETPINPSFPSGKAKGFIKTDAMEKGCIKMEKEDGKSTETIFSYLLGDD